MGGTNKRTHDNNFNILRTMFPDEKCFNCFKTPSEIGIFKHEIHHIDGDDTNQDPLNLLWACHGCNHKADFRKTILIGTRERTPEQKKAEDRKPIALQWVWNLLQDNNRHYNYDQLIAGMSYNFDISIITARRWLVPFISDFGPYKKIAWGKMGEIHVCVKGTSFDLEASFSSMDYSSNQDIHA